MDNQAKACLRGALFVYPNIPSSNDFNIQHPTMKMIDVMNAHAMMQILDTKLTNADFILE